MEDPVFIKYGSPSVSSRVTTHKQRDIKSCLREPEEVKMSDFLWSWQWLSPAAVKARQLSRRYSVKPSISGSPPEISEPLWMLKNMVRHLNADWTKMLRSDSDVLKESNSACNTMRTTQKGHASKEYWWGERNCDWVKHTSEFVLITSPLGGC